MPFNHRGRTRSHVSLRDSEAGIFAAIRSLQFVEEGVYSFGRGGSIPGSENDECVILLTSKAS